MWKLLIFCLFAITYPADAAPRRIKAVGARRLIDVAIHPITSTQALPLIFFASTESKKVQAPLGLRYAEIDEGRLVSGTSFYTIPDTQQIFFCQNPDSRQMCLVPKKFETAVPLECPESEVPTPVLQPFSDNLFCGPDNSSFVLMFNYHICPAESPYIYDPENFRIYTLCYDAKEQKMLFASYTIMMAILLDEGLLSRERQVEFTMNTKNYELIDQDYYNKLQNQTQLQYPDYDLQTLVPPEDMPLATFKKVTNYYANFALQHKEVVKPWNNIRSHIRNQAILLARIQNYQEYFIMTGVFDIPENDEIHIQLDGKQMATIWVTTVITGDRQAGLAILMNNFITDASTSEGNDENSQQKYIDKLCHNEDLCMLSLKESFKNVKGEIRCCKITQNITNLFSPGTIFAPSTLLHMLNINWPV